MDKGEPPVSTGVPELVSRTIEDGQLPESQHRRLFVECLKENRFEIRVHVDSEEALALVSWVESAEHSGKWE
jgi:hypothetical protein